MSGDACFSACIWYQINIYSRRWCLWWGSVYKWQRGFVKFALVFSWWQMLFEPNIKSLCTWVCFFVLYENKSFLFFLMKFKFSLSIYLRHDLLISDFTLDHHMLIINFQSVHKPFSQLKPFVSTTRGIIFKHAFDSHQWLDILLGEVSPCLMSWLLLLLNSFCQLPILYQNILQVLVFWK